MMAGWGEQERRFVQRQCSAPIELSLTCPAHTQPCSALLHPLQAARMELLDALGSNSALAAALATYQASAACQGCLLHFPLLLCCPC